MELDFFPSAALVAAAFLCEFMDSSLGMGYGTTLAPLLLLAGFRPLQIVPVILLSELVTGLLAAFCHHRSGNVRFLPAGPGFWNTLRHPGKKGCLERLKREIPRDLVIALVLASCSIGGTLAAVLVAVSIPRFYLKLYIGCLVFLMCVVILLTLGRRLRFSWIKLAILGVAASFNKGLSGGGYGPLVTGGQILSGVEGKNAVGITSLSEGLTCAVGLLAYFLISENPLDFRLAPYVILGSVLSVPFSALCVKRIGTKKLTLLIAIITILLGGSTIWRTIAGSG